MKKKILRSLPNRFHSKVTAIEESKDIESMKVKELVVSLRTYELHLHRRRKKEKGLGIAFWAKDVEIDEEDDESESDEMMAMLTNNLRNSWRIIKKEEA